ncbi:MAG: hypothetical protein ACK4K9_05570 [Bacteroidia bacterium]
MNKEVFVFIGPAEIAGFYTNLNKGLLELGYNSNYLGIDYYSKKYQIHKNEIFFIKFYKRVKNFIIQRNLKGQKIFYLNYLIKVLYILIFLTLIFKANILIFGFNSSLFPKKWDFPIWKFFKKKLIVCCFHGAEIRPPFLDGVNNLKNNNFISSNEIKILINSKIKEIRKAEKYASVIVAAPTNCHYLTRPFINIFQIGLAVDASRILSNEYFNQRKDDNLVFVHAPSSMMTKGTEIIREAINELKKTYKIDYIELTGLNVKQVYEKIIIADLVIDQVYSDTPMAGLATEASALGVPTLVAGYELSNIISNFIPNFLCPPTLICKPYEIKDKLEYLINNQNVLKQVGIKCEDFVKTKWCYLEVANRFTKLFTENIPNEWYLNPQRIEYVSGAGLSKLKRDKIVYDFINKYGEKALGLNDKNTNRLLNDLAL